MGWYTFYLSCTDFSFLMAIFFAMNVVPYRTELVMRPFQDRSCRRCRSHGHIVVNEKISYHREIKVNINTRAIQGPTVQKTVAHHPDRF